MVYMIQEITSTEFGEEKINRLELGLEIGFESVEGEGMTD